MKSSQMVGRHFAIQAVVKNCEALIAYFERYKPYDPVAKYYFKKLANNEYRIALEVLNGVFKDLV